MDGPSATVLDAAIRDWAADHRGKVDTRDLAKRLVGEGYFATWKAAVPAVNGRCRALGAVNLAQGLWKLGS